ncbi:MAG: hypothetical protein JST45_08565, partial [Bacteroidetes bacterium]|nr:hypothetical protein [Bacteroidota bacterium]
MKHYRRLMRSACAALAGAVAAPVLMAQTTRITGVVTDAGTGEPLPFVNISFTDSRVGTNSDIDGS